MDTNAPTNTSSPASDALKLNVEVVGADAAIAQATQVGAALRDAVTSTRPGMQTTEFLKCCMSEIVGLLVLIYGFAYHDKDLIIAGLLTCAGVTSVYTLARSGLKLGGMLPALLGAITGAAAPAAPAAPPAAKE